MHEEEPEVGGKSVYDDRDISFNGEVWFFCDSGESVRDSWMKEPCERCSKVRTTEGHDRCLGTLDGVRNACCGHGQIEKAYVQFWDKTQFDGNDAIAFFEQAKKDRQ